MALCTMCYVTHTLIVDPMGSFIPKILPSQRYIKPSKGRVLSDTALTEGLLEITAQKQRMKIKTPCDKHTIPGNCNAL